MTRRTLVYDEDCGFCRRSVRWVIARTAGRVEPVPVLIIHCGPDHVAPLSDDVKTVGL